MRWCFLQCGLVPTFWSAGSAHSRQASAWIAPLRTGVGLGAAAAAGTVLPDAGGGVLGAVGCPARHEGSIDSREASPAPCDGFWSAVA